ncbi:MAG TPA: hypothetical protein VF479_01385, partial [Pseudolysinimonas sp.]
SFVVHSTRHSLAFWLHQIGVAPADAAALLGHSVEVHLAVYLLHSGAAGIQAAARTLGQAAQQQQQAASGLVDASALCATACATEPFWDRETPHPWSRRMVPLAL